MLDGLTSALRPSILALMNCTDNIRKLREGRINVGFVPQNELITSAAFRFRGLHPVQALRKLGVNICLCKLEEIERFDLVILSRLQGRFGVCKNVVAKLNAAGIPVVFDLCDEFHAAELERGAIDFLNRCQAISTSSVGMQTLYSPLVKPPVRQIDDIVDNAPDLDFQPTEKEFDKEGVVRIGYTGTSDYMKLYILPLVPVFKKLQAALPGRFKFNFLTSTDLCRQFYPDYASTEEYLREKMEGLPFTLVEWKPETCVAEAAKAWDVSAILSPDSKRDSCNRLVFSTFAGSLSFANGNEDHKHALEPVAPELLCSTGKEWYLALHRAITDRAWRVETQAKVQRDFSRRFSAGAIARRWLVAMEDALVNGQTTLREGSGASSRNL